jgi:hypothetical protein
MITDAMHAEAVAMLNAFQLAEQLGVGRAIFETDCMNFQKAIISSEHDCSPLGVLIRDLRFRLQMSFIEARVVYVP